MLDHREEKSKKVFPAVRNYTYSTDRPFPKLKPRFVKFTERKFVIN